MADYINALSKIYSFIAKEGIWKMDYDQNGEIIEAECKYFLKQNLSELNLEDTSEAEGIIAQFWKDINTNRSVKSIASLDSKEIDALEKSLGIQKFVLEYTDSLNPPAGLGENAGKWKSYVVGLLNEAINEHGGVDSFKSEEAVKEFLDSKLPEAKLKATASCLSDNKNQNLLKSLNLEFGLNMKNIPSDLQTKLENYIKSLNVSDFEGKSDEEVKGIIEAELQKIIDEYKNNDKMETDLNKSILQKEWTQKLAEAVKGSEIEQKIAKLGKTSSDVVSAFVKQELANVEKTASLKDLMAKDVSELIAGLEKYIESDYKKLVAKDEVMGLLTSVKTETTDQTVFEYVYSEIEKRFSANNDVKANRAVILNIINEVLPNIDKNRLVNIANQALAYFDVSTVDGCKEFAKEIMTVFGVDENTKYGQSENDKESDMLKALVKSGVGKELATMILNLTPEERSAKSEYQEVIDAIISDYADGKIADRAALIKRLSDEINKLIKAGVFQDLQDKIDATTVDTSKKSKVLEECINVVNQTARLTFRILDDGTIEFVKWSSSRGGVFNKEKDETVQGYFDTVKDSLESTYSKNIDALNLSPQEKLNLWNIALFQTVSDTSVVTSMYKEMKLTEVVNKLVDNYIKLLQKIMSDENARNYISNSGSLSLLNGRTMGVDSKNLLGTDKGMTKDMSVYYDNNTTNEGAEKAKANGDDWVCKSAGKTGRYEYDPDKSINGDILYWYTGNSGDAADDDDAVNSGLNRVLNSYIANYKEYLSPEEIIKCFKEAEEVAFAKLQNTYDKSNPGDTQIYGYSENGSTSNDDYDTWSGKYLSVQAILLEVMYEMEIKLNQKVLG